MDNIKLFWYEYIIMDNIDGLDGNSLNLVLYQTNKLWLKLLKLKLTAKSNFLLKTSRRTEFYILCKLWVELAAINSMIPAKNSHNKNSEIEG